MVCYVDQEGKGWTCHGTPRARVQVPLGEETARICSAYDHLVSKKQYSTVSRFGGDHKVHMMGNALIQNDGKATSKGCAGVGWAPAGIGRTHPTVGAGPSQRAAPHGLRLRAAVWPASRRARLCHGAPGGGAAGGGACIHVADVLCPPLPPPPPAPTCARGRYAVAHRARVESKVFGAANDVCLQELAETVWQVVRRRLPFMEAYR